MMLKSKIKKALIMTMGAPYVGGRAGSEAAAAFAKVVGRILEG